MTKTFTAAFAQDPKTAVAIATNAVSAIHASTPSNTVELLTAGPEGCIVTSLIVQPRATTTAANMLLFIKKQGETSIRLIDTTFVEAKTTLANTPFPFTKFNSISQETPLRLEAGATLYVGTMVSLTQGYTFFAQYTDY